MASKVTTHHPAYDYALDRWKRIRDAIDGEDCVKKAGTRYLPMLSGWEMTAEGKTKYEAYKTRATWYGAAERTVQGLVGALGRKDPETEGIPQRLAPRVQDIDRSGTPLPVFVANVSYEACSVSRMAVLVDAPLGETRDAYLTLWKAEQIINWLPMLRDGVWTLAQVVFEQCFEERADDGYTTVYVHQWREHRLDDAGLYEIRIFDEDPQTPGTALETPAETFQPTVAGARIDYVPVLIFGARSLLPMVEKPLPLDLVDMNYSHYRSSADLEHGRHACALPTPYVIGGDPQRVYPLGPTEVWELPSGGAVGMLEFSGQGVAALERALDEKERKMALLGARLLEENKRAAETAEAMRLRQAGEAATLTTVATTVSMAMTKCLRWWGEWVGIQPDPIKLQVNKDFTETGLLPNEAVALMQLWQSGGISQDTFLYLLKEGELWKPGRTIDEELALLAQAEPAALPADTGGGPPPPPDDGEDQTA